MNAAALLTQWDRAAVRGCMLCDHGHGPESERQCTHPDVAPRGQTAVPVTAARSNNGGCGPEARHMYFAGLYSRR